MAVVAVDQRWCMYCHVDAIVLCHIHLQLYARGFLDDINAVMLVCRMRARLLYVVCTVSKLNLLAQFVRLIRPSSFQIYVFIYTARYKLHSVL